VTCPYSQGDYPAPPWDGFGYLGDNVAPLGENDKCIGDEASSPGENSYPQLQKTLKSPVCKGL